jgi:pilus assembly protein Flp/PilA
MKWSPAMPGAISHDTNKTNPSQERAMNAILMSLYATLRNLVVREEGQDLVEYALVVALIAFGAVTGMGYLATSINNAFSSIATLLTSSV